MKKCPYCAELIQDEAIVCRYCGRDLPEKTSVKPTISYKVACKLSPGYSPPEEHIDIIYKRYIDKLRQGEWKYFAHPREYSYRRYQGRISLEEYSKIKMEILVKGWERSDKTPKGLIDYIMLHPPKTKRRRLSVERPFEESAIHESIDMLRHSIFPLTEEAIRKNYPNYLERIIKFALSEEIFEENYKSPIFKLNSMQFSRAYDVPIEYFDRLIIEARNHIKKLLEEYDVELFVPLSKRPGIVEDMNIRAIRIADKLDNYHKNHFDSNDPFSFIVESSEIDSAVEEATKGDNRYDNGAKAMLYLKVQNELKNRGYM